MNEDDLKAAKVSHNQIDKNISQHMADLGIEGMVTGWTLSVSLVSIEHGGEIDGLYTTQSDGLSKWAQIGLLNMSLKGAMEDGVLQ